MRQLECFRALMIHGTMTRAAEVLGMSQPGVSATIAALEHTTGLQLFIRRGSRLYSTPEAKLLYIEASRALDAVENTVRIAKEIRAGRRGQLSVVAYPNISIAFLPRVMADFCAQRPDLHIKIITRQSHVVKELISTQTFDFAITELPTDYPTSHMEVVTYECVCMLPQGHQLASKDVITPQDLHGIPFISLFHGDPLYQRVASVFSEENSNLNIVAETEFLTTACELVAAGHGVGLIDPVISKPFTRDLVLRPFRPSVSYEIAILLPLHEELSQIALAFKSFLMTRLAAGV